MDADDVLENATGRFGRWQMMFILLIYMSKFAIIWHQTNIVIIAPPTEFNCSDPELDKCASNCTEHVFDKSIFTSTIIMKWDLVCDRQWIPNCSQTIAMFGILIGNYMFGPIADNFGRKWPFIISVICQVITGVACAFIPWLWLYIFVRFLCHVATGGTMLTSFVLLMEMTVKKNRVIVGVLFHLPFYMGYGLLGVIGYFIRDWQYSQLVISLPSGILIIYICLLPESARWCMLHGLVEKAVNIFEGVAKCNHRPIEAIRGEVLSCTASMQGFPKSKFTDLFRTPRMRCKTLCLAFIWFSISMVTYATMIHVGKMGGNIFLNIVVAGLLQLPGQAIVIPIMMFAGRKLAMIVSFVFTFVPWTVMIFLPKDPTWPATAMASTSLCGSAMCFSGIYVLSSELFPTGVRNTGMGLVSAVSRIGSMLSPQILQLDIFLTWLPSLIMAVFPFVSMLLLIFFIPDTLNISLPDSIEEADKL